MTSIRDFWTDEQDAFLIANYGVMSTAEIADKLKRTYGSVVVRANLLGLEGVKRVTSRIEQPHGPEALFDVKEAALRLGCHPGLVRNLIKDGKLEAERRGRLLRISQASIDEYRKTQRIQVQQEQKKPEKPVQKLSLVVREKPEDETAITIADIKRQWK